VGPCSGLSTETCTCNDECLQSSQNCPCGLSPQCRARCELIEGKCVKTCGPQQLLIANFESAGCEAEPDRYFVASCETECYNADLYSFSFDCERLVYTVYDSLDCRGEGAILPIDSCYDGNRQEILLQFDSFRESVNVTIVPNNVSCVESYEDPECTRLQTRTDVLCGCSPYSGDYRGIITDCDRNLFVFTADSQCNVQSTAISQYDRCDNGIIVTPGECREEVKQQRRSPCTMGWALVHDYGQSPTISISNGQPLVTPRGGVLCERVYAYSNAVLDDMVDQPFQCESSNLLMNAGEKVVLLGVSNCPYYSLEYAGLFVYTT
jgi:hypothetical protein